MRRDVCKLIQKETKKIYHYRNGDIEVCNNTNDSVSDKFEKLCNRNYSNRKRRLDKIIKNHNISTETLDKAYKVLSNEVFVNLFSTKYPEYIRDILIAFINKNPTISEYELIDLFSCFAHKARKVRYFTTYMRNCSYISLDRKQQKNILKDLKRLNSLVDGSENKNVRFSFSDIMTY